MVEIIPKKTKKASEWYNFGFYIVGVLLIVVVLVYAVLFYFEGKTWDVLQDLEDKINQVGVKEEKVAEAKALIAQKRINDFSKLLKSHKKSSNFFILLEENCHPQVWLTGLELNPERAEALVSGRTSDFQALGQQLFIFRQQDSIERVELTNLLINEEGETEFSLYLYLDPQIFQ